MSKQLEYRISKNNDQSVSILLTGFIDELTREVLFRLKGELPESLVSVSIDTSGIARISSIGIAHYSAFVKSLKNVNITYRACSVVFMDFLSMLPAVKGDARVESFYGSYFCERCDDEFSLLVRTEDVENSQSSTCPGCREIAKATGHLEDKIHGF